MIVHQDQENQAIENEGLTLEEYQARQQRQLKPKHREREQRIASLSQYLRAIQVKEGSVHEIRALDIPERGGKFMSRKAAYFRDPEVGAKLAAELEDENPKGVFITLNPAFPECYARAPQAIIPLRVTRDNDDGGGATTDKDILERRWLLVDCDPGRRVADVAATETEKRKAIQLAADIYHGLQGEGWPTPIVADSGNGAALLYRIELPNNKESTDLISRCYRALNRLYAPEPQPDEKPTRVDETCNNPARLTRILGTWNRKGHGGDPDRPHRRSALKQGDLSTPPAIVPLEKLQELAAECPADKSHQGNGKPPAKANRGGGGTPHWFLMRQYLEDTGVRILDEKNGPHGSTKYVVACPFDASHSRGESAFFLYPSGAMDFKCFHDGCSNYGWHDAKQVLGAPRPEHWDPPKTKGTKDSKAKSKGTKTKEAKETAESDDSEIANVRYDPESDDYEPLLLSEIIKRVNTVCEGWPARIGKTLFTPNRTGDGVVYLEDNPGLFAWIQAKTNQVLSWRNKAGCVTKQEFYRGLQQSATAYTAIESLPHQPMIPGHHYAHPPLPEATGDALRQFVDFFTPATDIDRDLMEAAVMTTYWGNATGDRPCFVITSDDGRGVGKSTFVEMLGLLAGGTIDFSKDDDIHRIKGRLLTKDSWDLRIALLDNVKTLNFSWPEFEAILTAPSISGHQLYTGDARRPNTVVWFVTLNGAALSKDMAQRSVIIKLSKPEHQGDWESKVKQFVATHRDAVAADAVARLKEPAEKMQQYTRWGGWEDAVLSRLPEPSDAQRVIEERQGEADTERDTKDLIEDEFAGQLLALTYDLEQDLVHIPSKIAAQWYQLATNEKQSTNKVSRIIKHLASQDPTFRVRPNLSRAMGRGFLWGDGTQKKTDLETRLAHHQKRDFWR